MGYDGTADYLHKAWKSLAEGQKLHYAHHICRTHAIRFIKEQINTRYAERDESIGIFQVWMHQFLKGTDLWSFTKRVTDAVLIAGKKHFTKEVQLVCKNISKSASREGCGS
jgi:hypothetical protein